MKRLLVTGYKASELGIYSLKHAGIPIIKEAIRRRLTALLDEGLEWVVVSGQWGVELWAAEAALELKRSSGQLRLAVITPFVEQDEQWSEEKQTVYRQALQRADYVNSVSNSKYAGPWQFRAKDGFLLRNTDGLLLLYDEDKEGSPKFIREQAEQYARSVPEYRIIRIGADELQSVADERQTDWD